TGTTLNNDLYAVTCTSDSQCWAVGLAADSSGNPHALIERWDGVSWTIVPPPTSSNTLAEALYGVTCTGLAQCWAVGFQSTPSSTTEQTLIEQWNGVSWSIINSPGTGTAQFNELDAVTCTSASQCWAVGTGSTSSA